MRRIENTVTGHGTAVEKFNESESDEELVEAPLEQQKASVGCGFENQGFEIPKGFITDEVEREG